MGEDALARKREEFLRALRAAGGDPERALPKREPAPRLRMRDVPPAEEEPSRGPGSVPHAGLAGRQSEGDELDRFIQSAPLAGSASQSSSGKSLRFNLPSGTRPPVPAIVPLKRSLLPMAPDGPPKVDLAKVGLGQPLAGLRPLPGVPVGLAGTALPALPAGGAGSAVGGGGEARPAPNGMPARPKLARARGLPAPALERDPPRQREEPALSHLARTLLEDPHAAERLAQGYGEDPADLAAAAMKSASVSRAHPLFAGYLSRPDPDLQSHRQSLAEATAALGQGQAEDINRQWLSDFRAKQQPPTHEGVQVLRAGQVIL
eukprot:EG_transcript_13638